MPEIRWILLGLGLLLIGSIWWWGSRKSGQAPGNAELRESVAKEPTPWSETTRDAEPGAVRDAEPAATREWSASPFEPLSIRTADFEQVPILDTPMLVDMQVPHPAAPPAATMPIPATVRSAATVHVTTMSHSTTTLGAGQAAAPDPGRAPAPAPHASEKQKIVAIRVAAAGDSRWSGAALRAALEKHGLAYGRYQVFHRRHVDGRSLFMVASLIEPGSFDVAAMATQEFKGINLFAVLPGPVDALSTVDELFTAARGLAADLPGMLQDSKGVPLSPQRAAAIRDDVVQFQSTLPAS